MINEMDTSSCKWRCGNGNKDLWKMNSKKAEEELWSQYDGIWKKERKTYWTERAGWEDKNDRHGLMVFLLGKVVISFENWNELVVCGDFWTFHVTRHYIQWIFYRFEKHLP